MKQTSQNKHQNIFERRKKSINLEQAFRDRKRKEQRFNQILSKSLNESQSYIPTRELRVHTQLASPASHSPINSAISEPVHLFQKPLSPLNEKCEYQPQKEDEKIESFQKDISIHEKQQQEQQNTLRDRLSIGRNIVQENDYYYQQDIYIDQQPELQPFLLNEAIGNPILQVRRNVAMNLSDAVNESICFNTVFLLITVGKILVFLSLLFGQERACKQSLTVWLFFMFIHDLIYSIYTYMIVNTIRMSDYHEDPSAIGGFVQVPRGSVHNANHNDQVQQFQNHPAINPYVIQERANSSNHYTKILNQVTKYYYLILFLIGNIIIIGDVDCSQSSPNHFNVAVAFLILGYIYLGVPIIILFSLCLCLPLVLLMYLIFNQPEGQRPLRRDLVDSLEKVKFLANSFHEWKDCCICMIDYKEGDDITILPCNKMHHFHEECVKKWLLINGVCPICRKSIEESVQQLQQINANR